MPRRPPVPSATSTPAEACDAILIPALDQIVSQLDHPRRLARSHASIHELRIATRRAQAAAQLLSPCLTDKTHAALRRQLRKLRRAAGKGRDAALVARALAHPRGDAAHRAAVAAVIRELRARARDALSDLSREARRRRSRLKDLRRKARREVADATRPADLARLAERALRLQRADIDRLITGDLADPDRLHRLRRRIRNHRYTLELLAPAFPGEARAAARLKKLQDALGAWMDARTAAHELEKRAPAPTGKTRTPDAAAPTRAALARRERAAHRSALRAVEAWHSASRRSAKSARATR